MKKFLYISCLSILTGCSSDNPTIQDEWQRTNQYRVVTVDGCEYLVFGAYQSQAVTHKGDCKSCRREIEKVQKALNTVIDKAEDKYGVDLR